VNKLVNKGTYLKFRDQV